MVGLLDALLLGLRIVFSLSTVIATAPAAGGGGGGGADGTVNVASSASVFCVDFGCDFVLGLPLGLPLDSSRETSILKGGASTGIGCWMMYCGTRRSMIG